MPHGCSASAWDKGLITHAVRSAYQSTMRFAPPLTVTTEDIDSGTAIMDEALREIVAA